MIINSILIGKGKGSAGNVTVNQLRGQTILKQKANIVANPNTEAQQSQRRVISKAVFVWQQFQNVIKSGWTSLLPFCSEYNTFVSTNATFFKNSQLDITNYHNSDVVGVQATKGRLGVLGFAIDSFEPELVILQIDKASLTNIAKVGDKVKFIIGAANQETMSYGEAVVTNSVINTDDGYIGIPVAVENTNIPLVYCAWLEGADGKSSTSAFFKRMG